MNVQIINNIYFIIQYQPYANYKETITNALPMPMYLHMFLQINIKTNLKRNSYHDTGL